MSRLLAQVGGSDDGALFVLLAWVILGPLVGHAIGKPKGHAGTGVVLGLLFSVLGWVIVALMSPAPGYGTTGPPVPTRPCPHCAEDIKPAAVVCRFCGREVEPLSVDAGITADGVPLGWDMHWTDFREVEQRYPTEVDQLRDASTAAGHPYLSAKHVRMAITDVRHGVTPAQVVARYGKVRG